MSVTVQRHPQFLAWLIESGALPGEALGMHEDVLLARIVDVLGDVRLRFDGRRWEARHGLMPWTGVTKLEAAVGLLAVIVRAQQEGQRTGAAKYPRALESEPEVERHRRLVG